MAGHDTTSLSVSLRDTDGSPAARRLRREGQVPGIVYGGGDVPQAFSVDARILRNTLAHAHAVIEVSIDGAAATPVIVKDIQRHPVRGDTLHVDLLRVRMDQTIHSTVALELLGGDEAPGVVEGGILNQETRELNIEALPGDIPDVVQHDVSDLDMNATVLLSAVRMPAGVTLLDDPEETVIATITPPTLEPVEEEVETETVVIGEDGEIIEVEAGAEGEGESGEESRPDADDSGES
jgi:large subunit ribosomal protein L25